MSTCGSFIFSGSEDGLVYVWDTETGNKVSIDWRYVYCILYDLEEQGQQG